MKTFRDYLTESQKTYKHRVKLAGETPDGFFDAFEQDLKRYGITGFTSPKKTPVMKKLPDFPDSVENQEMYIVDITLDYPANEEQIRQIAVKNGKQPDHVIISTIEHDDSNTKAAEEQEKNSDGALLDKDYEPQTAEQKKVSDEYARGQTTAAANSVKTQYKFAGELPEKAKTTNDLPQGVKSPMSKINRPKRPATGSRPEKE